MPVFSGDHRSSSPEQRSRSVFHRLSGNIQEERDSSVPRLTDGNLVRPNEPESTLHGQVRNVHVRINDPRMCFACGDVGHIARFCTRPKYSGLWPFIRFEPFNSPLDSAWAPGEVESWFAQKGPAIQIRQATSFKELVTGFFPNFQPRQVPDSSHSSALSFCATPSTSSPPTSAYAPPRSELRQCDAPPMANIPIDPQPFVPHGF